MSAPQHPVDPSAAPSATDAHGSLQGLVDDLLESYASDSRACRVGRRYLPSRDAIIDATTSLLGLMYPGYHGRQDITLDGLRFHVGAVLADLKQALTDQVALCLSYNDEVCGQSTEMGACRQRAEALTAAFLTQLPGIRRSLIADVQAAYDGDPAATNLDEVILAYPGVLAISVYRLAHALHLLGVPLMPRIMSEWAHAKTGADIHPGARIGPSFFLDHATGAVVGETTDIGAHVKLYQGVTLGALSHPRDEGGRIIRGQKRHPTVEDNVTIYANATVLGGTTVVGRGSLVGGSVFLTHSTPPDAKVAMKAPELRMHVNGGLVEKNGSHGNGPQAVETKDARS